MPTLVYSRLFRAETLRAANDLKDFFNNIKSRQPSLVEYRRYARHQQYFRRFQQELDAIEKGHLRLSYATIGSIFSNKKTYILHVGPWRGYLRKKNDGTIVALLFADCR